MRIDNYLANLSLRNILIIGLILRLIAAFFSEGYGMSDDHFLVIEIAKDWSNGEDNSKWFTQANEPITSGRSILYPGINYLIFEFLDFIGIEKLRVQMYFIRIMHALFSLMAINYIFKITNLLYSKKVAIYASLSYAILWFVPYMSVRNLVEMVVIVPLLSAIWYSSVWTKEGKQPFFYLLIGLLFGLCFSIRYQILLFPIGYSLGLLWNRRWKEVVYMTLGGGLWVALFHGFGDYLSSGQFFGKLIFYLEFNLNFVDNYISAPWFHYLFTLIIYILPPVSLFLLIGLFNQKREWIPILTGTLFFVFVHSIFQGKQERFIFPMIPLILILGYGGWAAIYSRITSQKLRNWIRYSFQVSGGFNILALVLLTFWFSKSSRVKLMDYFYNHPQYENVIVINTTQNNESLFPIAYASDSISIGVISDRSFLSNGNFEELYKADAIVIERRFDSSFEAFNELLKEQDAQFEFLKTVNPSLMDKIHNTFNRTNANNNIYDVYTLEPKQE